MIVDRLAQRTVSSVYLQGEVFDPTTASTWKTWLSEEERRRLASYGAQTRQHEFLLGRALARTLLASHLNVAPVEVPLHCAEDDGVDVEVGAWHVSIAHSEEAALVGVAEHSLGVDLEAIRPRDAAVAEFLFAPDDRGLIDRLPYDFDAALVLCWALKESVLKARRSGFRRSPKELQLSVTPDKGHARVQVQEGRAWDVAYARLGDFWGTVAVPAS